MIRLADVEEMAEAPPEGARAALRPGEIAGLYAVHPPSLGAPEGGMEPFEALVVDSPWPGVFLGELPDGSRFEFSERNVGWFGSSMGGVFDWVKKAFKGALPPAPVPIPGLPAPRPRETLPALPPPAPPPSPVKESFLRLFAPARPPEAAAEPRARPSLFEWFRSKAPAVPPGLPALRPEAPVIPVAPRAPGIIRRFVEKAAEMIPPPPTGPLIELPEMFRHIKPAPEEDFEAKQARQLQLWDQLFPQAAPGREEASLAEMFEAFTPEEAPPPPPPETLPPVPAESLKILPLPPRTEILPSPSDVARGFVTRYPPIEELWEMIRRIREDPAFQAAVLKGMEGRGPGARFEFESLGMCDQYPDPFQALAAFLNIPWSEVERIGKAVRREDEYGRPYIEFRDMDEIHNQIVWPAQELIRQAFELIKPADLRTGFFSLTWGGHKEHSCQLLVGYTEGAPDFSAEMDPAIQPFEPSKPSPEGFTTLGDVMPPEAAAPATEILNRMQAGEIDRDEAREELAALFEGHRAALEAKGVLPDFLAAYLSAMIGRSEEEVREIQEQVRKVVEKEEKPKKRRRR